MEAEDKWGERIGTGWKEGWEDNDATEENEEDEKLGRDEEDGKDREEEDEDPQFMMNESYPE